MKLTQRDKFFIREAFKAAAFYKTPDDWLCEVLNDIGHTVEQSLACDAEQIIEPLLMGKRTTSG